ncbi:MAG: M50 family metallopeptidase [Ruminococcaceae bacterium]|nr:M50 family metallopeptidase [Oscillospiraceae bacterium]
MNDKRAKKKASWQKHLSTAVSLLVGCFAGILLVPFLDHVYALQVPFSVLFLLAAMIFAVLVQLVIHEAGHLVFGLLTGYRFISFRIANLIWVKENDKIKCRRLHVAGTAGQCLMAPPEPVDGKMPVVLYNLGGALMNAVSTFVFFGLYALLPGESLAAVAMSVLAIMGLVIAITNAVPMRTGTVDNDGYHAVLLACDEDALRSFWVQLKVTEQTAKGVRLKDMPEEWFVVPADEKMKNSLTAAIGVFACNRLMDAHAFDEANTLMAHMLETDNGMVGLHRSLMICDRMYCELITQNRRAILNEMQSTEQKKFMKAMKNFPSVLRTEYVYALLHEKDRIKASKLKAQFEKLAKKYPYPSDIQSERELMEIAETRMDARSLEC